MIADRRAISAIEAAREASVSQDAALARSGQGEQPNDTYELFMGILTMISLAVMAWLLFAGTEEVRDILIWVDTVFCGIFLADFARSLRRAPDKRAYLLPRGILDLLGSVPAVGIMRIFRVFRLLRVARLIRGRSPAQLARDFVHRRAESAVYVIAIAAILVLLFGSTFIVGVEGGAEGANITSASDAIWWAFVTITTVGYGDRYPVTEAGRIIAVFTMATGIGIFGIVTSILASAFMGGRDSDAAESGEAAANAAKAGDDAVASELAALRHELAELRAALVTVPPVLVGMSDADGASRPGGAASNGGAGG
jgi:voltage-gated potassium channel Kch